MIKSVISFNRKASVGKLALFPSLKSCIRRSTNTIKCTSEIITSIEINMKEIQFKHETYGTTIEAIGDCCSGSYIFLPKGFNKDQYVGKIFDKIEEIGDKFESKKYNFLNPDITKIIKMEYRGYKSCIKNTEYKICFTDTTYFYILLKNYSNGYYRGWLEIIKENYTLNELLQNNLKILNSVELIIVVGLPASGKTTYCQQKYPEYTLYDDYLDDIHNNTLSQHIQNNTYSNQNNKVIINDPRLCDITIFKQQVEYFLTYVNINKMRIKLFENQPDECIINSQLRNDKDKDINLPEQILAYSQNYDLDWEITEYLEYISKKTKVNGRYLYKLINVYRTSDCYE